MSFSSFGEKIVFYGVFILLFSLPLVFDKSQVLSFEIPKTNFLYCLTSLMVLGWLIRVMKGKSKKRVKKGKEDILISVLVAVFAFTIIITGFLGENWLQSFWGSPWRRQGIFTFCFYFIFFFITTEAFSWGLKRCFVAKGIVLGSFFSAIFTLNQAYHHFFLQDNTIVTYNGRLAGTFSNPNLMVGYFVLTIPFSFYLLRLRTTSFWGQRLFFLLNIFLSLFACFFAFSRGGVITLIFVFFVYLILNLSNFLRFFPLFLFVFLFLIFNKSFLEKELVFSRFSFYGGRLAIWQNGLNATLRRPLTGYGWENFEYAIKEAGIKDDFRVSNLYIDRAHNEFLEIAVATGIFGLIVYFLILFFSLKKAISNFLATKGEAKLWWQTLILSFTAFLIFVQLNFFLTTGYLFFWFILGAIND